MVPSKIYWNTLFNKIKSSECAVSLQNPQIKNDEKNI
jgi:hypothetical protein